MSNNKKVSINVVAYNQENYIAECLESILNQTHQNIEIIVSDDCSTDRTVSIAKEYQSKDPNKIKIVEADINTGMVGNANRGLKASSGDFYCSFAGDDLMKPTNIERQLKLLQENPDAVMCHANAEWFDSDTKEIMKIHHKDSVKDTSLRRLQKGSMICAPASLVRAKYLPSEYRASAGSVCDWVYFAEILSYGRGVYCHEPLIGYRRHSGNLSVSMRMYKDSICALDTMKELNLKIFPEINIGYFRYHGAYAKTFLKSGDLTKAIPAFFKSIFFGIRYITSRLYFKS